MKTWTISLATALIPLAVTWAWGVPGDVYVNAGNRILKYSGQNGAYLALIADHFYWGGSSNAELTFGPDGNLYGMVWDDKIIKYDFGSGITSVLVEYGDEINIGPSGLAIEPVPEPATLGLLLIATLMVMGRRRKVLMSSPEK